MRSIGMPGRAPSVLVTGATGLVGNAVTERLLSHGLRVFALVRHAGAWAGLAARLGGRASAVTPVWGDVTRPGLGLDSAVCRSLARDVSLVVHCAADTSFSRPLADARALNTAGTANLLGLMTDWRVARLAHVSTAFVAGARTGVVPEAALDDAHGFVNGYEQSKHEAESLVRASGVPCVVLRPSTIVCDDATGRVSQYNAVHRALRMFHAGFGSLVPGAEDTPVDLVTTAYVADGVVHALTSDGAAGTYQLCAGAGALELGELLDRAYAIWSRDAQWRRRGIARPALADLATYRVFEQAVEATGDGRLAAITRSLSHFVPQLALAKRFDTARADRLLDACAPPVRSFWDPLVERLAGFRRGAPERRVA